MASITERLPAPLSDRLSAGAPPGGGGGGGGTGGGGTGGGGTGGGGVGSGGSGAIFNPQGREVDLAVAGIPFRLATTPDLPQTVETIPIRREQLDTEADPGEQSLTSWWRRSQSSFHEGAGDLYQENSDRTVDSVSFYDSSGVDVFTRGQLTLLKKMVDWAQTPNVPTRIRTYMSSPSQTEASVSMVADGGLYGATTVGGIAVVRHNPGSSIVDGLISGSLFYDIASDGTLYSGQLASPTQATTWPLGGTPSRLAWGKHRLWVIGGTKIWQPNLSLPNGTAQSPIFTHPNAGWTYTCLAEGSSAMLFGGHDGMSSSIQSVTLDANGGLPTLSGAAITAVLPDGELIQELAVLAGQYVGIGTNRGFRVGVIDSNAVINYGPLIIEPAGVTKCSALTTQGRFFLVAFDTGGEAVAYRVDTGTPLDGGIFPYAKDISCGNAGSITSIAAVSGTRLVCTTEDGNAFYQSATDYVSSGFIQTGRIRYRTTEPKNFKYLALEIEPLAGNIAVSIIKEGGSTLPLGNVTTQGAIFTDRFAISSDPMKYASVRLDLTPTEDAKGAPVVHSYQMRAMPAVPPQRMITLPLLCYDKEKARSGQWYGGPGYARDRLTALQIFENTADSVLFQDFTSTDSGGSLVTIESIRFVETAPNLPFTNNVNGNGGIIVLQLRTIDG